MRSLAGLLLVCSVAIAQTPLCVRDAAGNQVCASAQEDTKIDVAMPAIFVK